MTARVHVTGVGMIPFAKPGKSTPYSATGEQAARAALIDAGLEYSQVQPAHVGYVYGDSTYGQAASYGLGQTVALGFEQMVPGLPASVCSDRPNPLMRFEAVRDELQQVDPPADQGRRQRDGLEA